jgi:hypothetical protein
MNQSQLFRKLEKERKILNMLIDEALKNGNKISEIQEIAEQSRKVRRLVDVIQKEMSKKTLEYMSNPVYGPSIANTKQKT